jgi:hypothetical protein
MQSVFLTEFIHSGATASCADMKKILQSGGAIVFRCREPFLLRLRSIEESVGRNFHQILNETGAVNEAHGWQLINERLGRDRWLLTRNLEQPGSLGSLDRFLELFGEAAVEIAQHLSPLNDHVLTPTTLIQVVNSGPNADDQKPHFDSDSPNFSWLLNTHGEYKFDYWKQSHVTLIGLERVLDFMATTPYGIQVPQQFSTLPTPLTTITLQQMEFVVFGHQVLHRGTRNEFNPHRHGRVFGSFQTQAVQSKFRTKVCRKDLTSETHFLEEPFWCFFEKCEEAYRR